MISTSGLDEFVAHSDRLGGPGHPDCEAYWATVGYRPDTVVDETLDPFSDEYVDQQLAVYREISGRDLDQLVNEHTTIEIDEHVNAVNPYNHGSPGAFSAHIERLSRALRFAAPPRGGKMLDMGCGWGLSAEVAAYAGLSVTAVDVNQDFVDLVNRRAQRFGHDIEAQHATFDDFDTDQRFDLVMFYECFHHALRPWAVLERMAGLLAPDGHVVLAGEPINDTWWKHWGLRLDPLSVYCIRKFGWLESGWTEDFLLKTFQRVGLNARIVTDPDLEIGSTVVGSQISLGSTTAAEIATGWSHDGWIHDGAYLVATGDSRLALTFPPNSTRAHLGVQNFRGSAITVEVRTDEGVVVGQDLPPGASIVEIPRDGATGTLTFTSDRWSPDDELDNGDTRTISFHLDGVTFL